ncbi:hypothetical protein VitviT2T_019560 [Vitis vinifera]|uniref:DUF4283 domain-containing protein n=1 Tax=Vitis vinifera TaxID=29760 RepID=A0ABY9D1P5_VITVI|nr:hypothetical protein VitviT2T_019560 [Vitis vinifera]
MEEGKGLQAGPSNTWAVEGVGCVVNEGTLIKPKARVERSTGLLNPEQRMGWQEDNLGWLSNGDQDQETRARTIVKGSGGPNVERGPILIERRPSSIGSDFNQAKRWAQVGSGPEAVLEEVNLNQPIARNKGNESLENRRLLDCIWESEEARSSWEKGIPSATDKALAEEAMRYDSGLSLERERGCGSSHIILYSFDRTPVGESFYHSGVLEESNDVGPGMDDKGCWDMVEFNKDPNLVRGVEWNTERTESQEVRRKKENRWEESSLAKFSHFLGFSTEGLEKEILNFLVKIRKRREKIHSKELMEKSKFERELKRLECSVNYEKGAGGLLICWDKRSMEVVDWEEGQYSLSCRFKNVEDGAVWVFTGVYGPFTKEAREGLWEELGAVRGIWEEPWCLGGDFNSTLYQRERSRQGRITSNMRRFAHIIEELGLVDLPLQGGVFTWSGGLNNQSWARLDRFLVTPS